MMTGRLCGDEVMHRIGNAKTFYWGCILAGAGLSAVALINDGNAVLLGLFIAGMGISVLFPILYDQAVRASNSGAKYLGAMTLGSRIGALGLPAIVGIISASQSFGFAFLLLGLPAIAMIVILRHRLAP